MKWLDNFIVSERGQWDYPGYPTAVPTKNGRITMEGVPYPLFAMDETGYGGMIYPGGNYQFRGNMVYEIPMAYGGDISIPDLSRPNWLDKAQVGQQVKYTTDPIKIQNYNDSLTVYNAFKNDKNRLNSFNTFDEAIGFVNDRINKHPEILKSLKRLQNRPEGYESIGRSYTKEFPVQGGSAAMVVEEFAKPKQPYKKYDPVDMLVKTPKLEIEPIQLVIPQSNRILNDYNNVRQVLRGIQEEDKSNQNLYPTRVVPAPDFRHGGRLQKFQGETGPSQVDIVSQQNKYFNEGLDFVRDWMDSPMYNQMVLNSVKGNQAEADYIKRLRRENLETMPSEPNVIFSDNPQNAKIAAHSLNTTGGVEVFPRGFDDGPLTYVHEIIHSTDRSRGKFDIESYDTGKNFDYHKKHNTNLGKSWYINKEGNVVNYPDWMRVDDPRFPKEPVWNTRVIPQSDVKYTTTNRAGDWKDNEQYIQNASDYQIPSNLQIADEVTWNNAAIERGTPEFTREFEKLKKHYEEGAKRRINADKSSWLKKSHGYIDNPTEVRARLGEIRFKAQKEGIYDPFTEQITPQIFERLKEIKDPRSNYNALDEIDELRTQFTDEEILWMLQNISYNNKVNADAIPTGKYGGRLEKYQGDKGSSQVKTYASDPGYFDNRAVFVDNSKANDLVRSKIYAGTHGWDPTTNSLVKLDKPVAVPEAVREMSTADYGKKNYKERFKSNTPAGKEVRKAAVAQGMKDMVQNPLLYAPGAVAAGALAAPALAGVSGALSAPLTIGSTVIPGATMGNAIGALGAADALVNRLPQIPGQLSRGEYLDAAINVGTGALDLYGVNMVSPLFKGAKAAAQQSGKVFTESNRVKPEVDWDKWNLIKEYKDSGIIPKNLNEELLLENPNLFNTVARKGIKDKISVTRSVTGRSVSPESEFSPQREAMKQVVTFDTNTQGHRVGLEDLPKDLNALYHYKGTKPNFVDYTYGPYTVTARYPFDFSSGNTSDWLTRYKNLESSVARPSQSGFTNKAGDIVDTGAANDLARAIIGPKGTKGLEPVKVTYNRAYNDFYNQTKGSDQALVLAEKHPSLAKILANETYGLNIADDADALKFLENKLLEETQILIDTKMGRPTPLNTPENIKTEYYSPFKHKFKKGGSNKWLDMYQGDEGSSQVNYTYSPEFGTMAPEVEVTGELPIGYKLAKEALPSGAIQSTLGPIEYALMPTFAAPAIRAAMTPKTPVDAELEAIRKLLRKNVTHPKQTGPLPETPPWPNRFLELGDDAWVIGNAERGRTSVENPDIYLPGNLPKRTPRRLPGVNGTQYPNRLPQQKYGGWLDNY